MKNFYPKISIPQVLSSLDWSIFFLCLFLTLCFVIYGNIKKRKPGTDEKASLLDHLLMGRMLTLPMFVATLVATWYGGIFGVTQIAFEKGIFSFLTQGIFWYVTYLIFAFYIVDKIKNSNAVTLPELLKFRFGRKAEILGAFFNFFNVVPIAYAISIGLFLQSIFGGSIELMTAIGISFVLMYSIFGGFRSVVYSDIFQFFIMCGSVLLILLFSIYDFGGISFLKDNLPQTHFNLTSNETLATTMVWGFIALSTLVDPNFYQRCFAAKNTKTAKSGIILSTIIWLVFDICTTGGAMYAAAVIPEASSSNAYLIYAIQILPEGLRGLMLAGIFATILSTIDSYLFIAGTTITYDILPKRYRNSLVLHRLGIVFVGILAIILSTVFEGNIKNVWKTLGSYSAACLLFPVTIGYIFPKKITDNQFAIAVCLGIIGTTYWRMASHTGFWENVDELYIGVLCTSSVIIPSIFLQEKKRLK